MSSKQAKYAANAWIMGKQIGGFALMANNFAQNCIYIPIYSILITHNKDYGEVSS